MRNDRERTPTPVEIPLPQPAAGYQGGNLTYPSRELTPVSVPVENSGGMDIKRLRVPLPMMISFLVGIISIAVAVTTVWLKTESHISTREAHIDIGEATRGGGVAYKNDVEKVRMDLERKMRKSLKSAKVSCRRDSSKDALTCDIYFQEE